MVHVHRSGDEKENLFLYEKTSKFIKERNAIRKMKGWGGTGEIFGIGEHIDRNGNHCNFVIKPQLRNQWSNEDEKLSLEKCGSIFKKHFGDKPVGFEEMIQQQRYLWPMDCSDELTDVPRCWNASLNLGNEIHNDNDGTRSYAVWVSNKKETSE